MTGCSVGRREGNYRGEDDPGGREGERGRGLRAGPRIPPPAGLSASPPAAWKRPEPGPQARPQPPPSPAAGSRRWPWSTEGSGLGAALPGSDPVQRGDPRVPLRDGRLH